jgi:hypothetical protein
LLIILFSEDYLIAVFTLNGINRGSNAISIPCHYDIMSKVRFHLSHQKSLSDSQVSPSNMMSSSSMVWVSGEKFKIVVIGSMGYPF